jgi:L-lactate dehydrogenase complex protein LldE
LTKLIKRNNGYELKTDSAHTDMDKQVSLFIPCLVDQVYPEIGLAMVKIMRHFGYHPFYDPRQTCCGQPAFNAGHRIEARKVAGQFIDVFQQARTIVAPSGSCTAMVRNYYPLLFDGHPLQKSALQVSQRIFEFSEFLFRENLIPRIDGSSSGRIGFHNSCHSYRELGLKEIPGQILNRIRGYEWVELAGEPVCCGFGGLFSFKYDYLAAAMAEDRLERFRAQKIDTVVSNDPGCIMHLRQEAKAKKINMPVLHLVEFLAQSMNL